MNMVEVLVKAQETIDEARISEDLRATAFQQCVQLFCREAGMDPAAPTGFAAHRGAATGTLGARSGTGKITRKPVIPAEAITGDYSDDGQGEIYGVVRVGTSSDQANKAVAPHMSDA